MHFCLLQLFLSQILFLIVVYVQEKIVKVLEKLIQKFPIYQPSASISQQSNGIRIIWFRHQKYFYILKMIDKRCNVIIFGLVLDIFEATTKVNCEADETLAKKRQSLEPNHQIKFNFFLIPDALCSQGSSIYDVTVLGGKGSRIL